MKINIQDILDAMETTDETHGFCLDPRTGQIIAQSGENGAEGCIALPDRHEIDDYGCMERYIDQLPEGQAKEWLGNAIRGRGAFRMFRAALKRFDLTEDWYRYRERSHLYTAMDWCDSHDIEYELADRPSEDEEDGDDIAEEEPAVAPAPAAPLPLRFLTVNRDSRMNLLGLTASYEAELAGEKGPAEDLEGAEDIISHWLAAGCQIIAAADHGRWIGFAVLRTDEFDNVSLTDLYIRPDCRRRSFGSQLFRHAEQEAAQMGSGMLKAAIDPMDLVMIGFLEANGYGTAGHIELLKNAGEGNDSIQIGSHRFRY